MDLDIHPHNHYMLMTDVEVAEDQVSCEKKSEKLLWAFT